MFSILLYLLNHLDHLYFYNTFSSLESFLYPIISSYFDSALFITLNLNIYHHPTQLSSSHNHIFNPIQTNSPLSKLPHQHKNDHYLSQIIHENIILCFIYHCLISLHQLTTNLAISTLNLFFLPKFKCILFHFYLNLLTFSQSNKPCPS